MIPRDVPVQAQPWMNAAFMQKLAEMRRRNAQQFVTGPGLGMTPGAGALTLSMIRPQVGVGPVAGRPGWPAPTKPVFVPPPPAPSSLTFGFGAPYTAGVPAAGAQGPYVGRPDDYYRPGR